MSTALPSASNIFNGGAKNSLNDAWKSMMISRRISTICYVTSLMSGLGKNSIRPQLWLISVSSKIHLAAPLFTETFFDACMRFQALCFQTYTGWGQDARLRAQFERRRQARPNDWRKDWDSCFGDSLSDARGIQSAYKTLMEAFASDIGVHDAGVIPGSGRVPTNIR
jgi:hypothetical protein